MSPDRAGIEPEGCGGNAAPYVLGALTGEEREAFHLHMESCVVCREEVAALELVAAALPAAAPQVRAPAELRGRIMSSVREEARQRSARDARDSRGARVPGAWRLAVPAWPRWRPDVAVAGLVAAMLVAVVIVFALGRGSGAGTRVIRAQAPRGASASVKVSGGHAQLNIADMPKSAPGHVYELWIKRSASGQPQPTDALFTVAADGAATVGVPGSVSGVREIMVTSEPLGGSRVPTLPVLILARVS